MHSGSSRKRNADLYTRVTSVQCTCAIDTPRIQGRRHKTICRSPQLIAVLNRKKARRRREKPKGRSKGRGMVHHSRERERRMISWQDREGGRGWKFELQRDILYGQSYVRGEEKLAIFVVDGGERGG